MLRVQLQTNLEKEHLEQISQTSVVRGAKENLLLVGNWKLGNKCNMRAQYGNMRA